LGKERIEKERKRLGGLRYRTLGRGVETRKNKTTPKPKKKSQKRNNNKNKKKKTTLHSNHRGRKSGQSKGRKDPVHQTLRGRKTKGINRLRKGKRRWWGQAREGVHARKRKNEGGRKGRRKEKGKPQTGRGSVEQSGLSPVILRRNWERWKRAAGLRTKLHN